MIKTVALALTACAALLLTGCGSESRTGACGMACCAEAKADCATCPACSTKAAKPACEACAACPMPASATAAPVK
jgi:hypothetical protein